jgi:1-acyl-sn-glycerol-3-phosphate acyltransferase
MGAGAGITIPEECMDETTRDLVHRLVRAIEGPQSGRWLDRVRIKDLGLGYDLFGLELESAALAYVLFKPIYRHYFRVESRGHEHIPRAGRAILVANHSGFLPYDGAMAAVDTVLKLDEPRLLRVVVDHFVAAIPWINVFMSRTGQVVGARKNVEELLRQDELVLIFPEGAAGIVKPYRRRYRLLPFRVGFVELSIRYRALVVPVAFVGAADQMPVLYASKRLGSLVGMPFFPITPTFPWLGPIGLLPLPARYEIVYGEPFRFHEDFDPEAPIDPRVAQSLAEEVQGRVQTMLDEGVARRNGRTYF